MGLRDDLSADIAEAFDTDLADAVTEFTGTRVTGEGTYDPVTEEWEPGTLTYTGRGVFGGYSVDMIDGISILRTDTKLTALQAEVVKTVSGAVTPETPKVDDTINGMKVISLGQDPAGASYSIQLRKV